MKEDIKSINRLLAREITFEEMDSVAGGYQEVSYAYYPSGTTNRGTDYVIDRQVVDYYA